MNSESITLASDRKETPDLRLLHFNDVYHVDASSAEPVGGVARFQTLCNYYRDDAAFKNQPGLITLFSGDAFNPSLESSITKGSHMVPVLNHVGTACACVGNHDLDFGVPQFEHLAGQCSFPWLLANVLDPALGENVPLCNAKPTAMLSTSNGLKIGLIGLVEREWLDTINSLPPNLIYKSASATAMELVPGLRKQGADIIIALTHQREPNDNKLASKTPPGLIDLVLGGHDHFYNHSLINDTHVLRSGTDFKQLSYIRAWRRPNTDHSWDFEIIRRDVVREIPEDPAAAAMVDKISASMKPKLEKPVGYVAAPLDARFTTVRMKESNIGNFVADLMRLYYQADCAIMASGTIRGDQIYPPGILRAKDLMDCFPFEDPLVVLRLSGRLLLEALENSVSMYPALEGRFPQVSNIKFTFDPSRPAMHRVTTVAIGNAPLDPTRLYTVTTRDYMARGKDGFTSLMPQSLGGEAEELVSDENGILISMLLRQYFMSLRVLGRWRRESKTLSSFLEGKVHRDLHESHPVGVPSPTPSPALRSHNTRDPFRPVDWSKKSSSLGVPRAATPHEYAPDEDSEGDHEHETSAVPAPANVAVRAREEWDLREGERAIIRKVARKWKRLAGLPGSRGVCDEEEFSPVSWTRPVYARVEGRIVIVGGEGQGGATTG